MGWELFTILCELEGKIYLILPVCGIVIVCMVIYDCYQHKKRMKPQYKEAGKKKAKGILFGYTRGHKVAYSPTDAEGHVAVFGGSGLGKTSALLIPTLRSWTGYSFAVDISGDISKNVETPNKLIYEPSNPASIPYNIFGMIDEIKDKDDQNEALEQLAFLLMPDDNIRDDAARFFRTEGRKILTASLISFYHKGIDFSEICEKIVRSSWQELFNEIDQTQDEDAIQYINSFVGASEQNTAGCKQDADSKVKLFATNARVKQTIRRPKKGEKCFTPQEIERNNVFVLIEDNKLKLYAPLLHIITAQTLDYFSVRSIHSETTILLCLDEFASLGKLEIVDALRKLRKRHVRIMMLTQSMSDIDLIYGKPERMAMMNNYRFKVILGADDTDTQDYFAKLIGQKEVQKKSRSQSARNVTHTVSEGKDWSVEPARLARLHDRLILLHPDGYVELRKNFYFNSK